jgi:hypothetical protein
MGKLVYLTNVSLDLLIEDEHGSLDWRAPSDELFVHHTNLIRALGTHLYGGDSTRPRPRGRRRRQSPELAAQSHLTAEFAGIWAAATRETSR